MSLFVIEFKLINPLIITQGKIKQNLCTINANTVFLYNWVH